MANYSQHPQFWPAPPYSAFAAQAAPIPQPGSHQQLQTMTAFAQNQSLPSADLETMGANAPQYAAFLENFSKASGFAPMFPPPPIGANGLPMPPPLPFMPPLPMQYDPLRHPGSVHNPPPVPVAMRQHPTETSTGPPNPRISEVQSQDREDGELSDAESASPGKAASPVAKDYAVRTAPEALAASHLKPLSKLHNRPLDRPSSEQPGSPHSSHPSNDSHVNTEKRDRAKEFLQLLHRSGVDQQALVKEGLNVGILRELYGELGISFVPEKAIQLVSAITNEASDATRSSAIEVSTPDVRPPITPAQSSVAAPPSRSDRMIVVEPTERPALTPNTQQEASVPLKTVAVSKPTINVPAKTQQVEDTKSPSAITPTSDRSAYIARLQAARSKKPAATIAQPSHPTASPSSSAVSKTEKVEGKGVLGATGPQKIPDAAQQHPVSFDNSKPIEVAPATVDEMVMSSAHVVNSAPVTQPATEKPVELSEADRKRQQQNEILLQKIARLKAIQAAKSSTPNTASPAVETKDLTTRVASSATEATSIVNKSEPSVVQSDARQNRGLNDKARAQKLSDIPSNIPGISMHTAANSGPAHKTPMTVSPAPINAFRKRPVASDFDDAPTSSSSGSVKRPFGLARNPMEHEHMVIEVSDDEAGMDIDDEDDGPDPENFNQSVHNSNQRLLGSMPPLTDTTSRPQRNIAVSSLTPSGLSTPSAQTPGGSSQQHADLAGFEKTIEDLRRKIAEAEGKTKAKKPSEPPARAMNEPLRAVPLDVVASTITVESAHVPKLSGSVAGDVIDTPASVKPPVQQSEAPRIRHAASTDNIWKEKKRQEIEQDRRRIQEERDRKVEEMNRQIALLQAQFAQELESKDLLLQELEQVGVDTDGMSLADLQATKDTIAEQHPGIFEDAAASTSQLVKEPQELSAPAATPLGAPQPTAPITSQTVLQEQASNDALGAAEPLNEQQLWQHDTMALGLPANSEPAQHSTPMKDDAPAAAQPAPSLEITAEELSDEGMEEYSPGMVISGLAERSIDAPEQRDDDGDEDSVSDVYDYEPEIQPAQIIHANPETDAYTGYVSSGPDDDDDLYSPEPAEAQESKGKMESMATPASGEQSDDYLGDMTPLTDIAKDGNVDVAPADEEDLDEDRMSTSDDSDIYEPSVLPAQAVLPAVATTHVGSHHPTIVTHEEPVSNSEEAPQDSDDDMEYDPADGLPAVHLFTAEQALQTNLPSSSPSSDYKNQASQSDSDIGRLDVADNVATDAKVEPSLDGPERLEPMQAPSSPLTADSKEQSGTRFFTPYSSALRSFKAYRFHPTFTQDVSGGFKSLTYSHNIKFNQPLCKFEAMGGTCNDDSCEDQHFRDMRIADDKILLQLGTANPGRTEEEKDRWKTGLRQVLAELRSKKARDPTVVAQAIATYRREFLQDSSRVLDLDVDFNGPVETS